MQTANQPPGFYPELLLDVTSEQLLSSAAGELQLTASSPNASGMLDWIARMAGALVHVGWLWQKTKSY